MALRPRGLLGTLPLCGSGGWASGRRVPGRILTPNHPLNTAGPRACAEGRGGGEEAPGDPLEELQSRWYWAGFSFQGGLSTPGSTLGCGPSGGERPHSPAAAMARGALSQAPGALPGWRRWATSALPGRRSRQITGEKRPWMQTPRTQRPGLSGVLGPRSATCRGGGRETLGEEGPGSGCGPSTRQLCDLERVTFFSSDRVRAS